MLLLTTTEKKYNNNSTSKEALKNSSWEVVEYQTLAQEAHSIIATLKAVFAILNPATCTTRIFQRARVTLKNRRRNETQHHMSWFSCCQIRKDPESPTLLPYRTSKDQYIRDFNRDIKLKMKEKALTVVG